MKIMRLAVPVMSVLVLLAAIPGLVSAESPMCHCQFEDVQVTVAPELACLTISEASVSTCYGETVLVEAKNSCAKTVVIKAIAGLNGEAAADKSIAPGETGAWQQPLAPVLLANSSTPTSISWNLESDGSSFVFTASATAVCGAPDGGGGNDGGCSMAMGSRASGFGMLLLTVFGVWAVSRRGQRSA